MENEFVNHDENHGSGCPITAFARVVSMAARRELPKYRRLFWWFVGRLVGVLALFHPSAEMRPMTSRMGTRLTLLEIVLHAFPD